MRGRTSNRVPPFPIRVDSSDDGGGMLSRTRPLYLAVRLQNDATASDLFDFGSHLARNRCRSRDASRFDSETYP